MDQTILLFLQRDMKAWTLLSLPSISIVSIITNTYTRNKTIHQNRTTSSRFILSGNTEKTKRIKLSSSVVELHTHSSVRYINTSHYKVQNKNAYQGVVSPINGGSRP